jgi:polyferredoxin
MPPMDPPERDRKKSGAVVDPTRRRVGGWKAARWTRRAVQIAGLLIFVYLLFAALQRLTPNPFADIFFRFDPLAALATMLAARAWLPHLAPAFITVALTVLLGRYWCGWICPLGTLLGWTRFRSARRRAAGLPAGLRRVKYVVLGVVVVLAGLANLTFLVLDPISLLTRAATTSLVPGLVYVINGLESWLMGWSPTVGFASWMDGGLRGTLLPSIQPRYEQALMLFLILLVVFLLDLLADRFWCRYLCPLGALLGLIAKVQVLRPVVGAACDRCDACVRSCRVGAIEVAPAEAAHAAGGSAAAPPASAARVVSSECTMCLDCLVACPKPGAMGFAVARRPGPWAPYDPGRREALTAVAAGVGAAVLFGVGVSRSTVSPGRLRPPGAQDEARFLSRCLRCTECMRVCPTSGLQPALGEAGIEGIWTPVLKPRLGYCDYACAACGHVCPSGAIPKLGLAEKRTQVIGIAVVDRSRCLPWAFDTPCIVCQEMCPTPRKAIALDKGRAVTNAQGGRDRVKRPTVIPELCIGCGICEYKCPVEGTAAIVVLPANPRLALPGSGPG